LDITIPAKVLPIPGIFGQHQQVALDRAKRTINEITGFEANDIIAKVHFKTGKVNESKVGVKIIFGVEHS
jgi:flavin-binding protein dodecin